MNGNLISLSIGVFILFMGFGGLVVSESSCIDVIHRGTFQANLGLRDELDPIISLDGIFRDFRRGHVIGGTATLEESQRTTRFQGIVMRTKFLIQATAGNRIINIVGKFVTYNEEQESYEGVWRGFVVRVGNTQGWISAKFN